MANPEQVEILRQGEHAWNRWRRENPEVAIDLAAAPLAHFDPVGPLSRVNLRNANLEEAHLNHANLARADLSGARLRKANLHFANLDGAELFQADFRGARLTWANLSRAHFTFTNLETAILGYSTIADVGFTGCTGLETVQHEGPSSVGIDTLCRSWNQLPRLFLRGCGLPDALIEYLPSLLTDPMDFYSCFISCSSHDRTFADRLYALLQTEGIRCWYFFEDATWGEGIWSEIDKEIAHHDKLVVICSEHSLQSGPVLREIERALQREDQEGRNVLFPITIDDYLFKRWEHPRKADVLSKVIGDFRGRERVVRKRGRAFERLLKALQARVTAKPHRA